MGNRMGIIFTSIASNITTISITPIIVAVLCLPILIAFFMIIINSGAYVVPPAGRHSGPGGLYPSCWPLDTGVITQLPPHGLTQRLDAFDIGTNQQNGIPVYATHDGTVHNFTDPNTPSQGSYGTYVKVVSDEGFCTLYGHLASHSRSEGETVFAGDEIGLSDNTGTSTGPHLHYEYQEPCTSYAGVIPGSTLITNYVPPGYTLGGSIQYSGSCFASQQGGSATAP
jgi:murein DD-endopeptidase MepM/ murein hydrolase activator NlpD